MACALRITFPGAFYHVTSRGDECKAVFKTKRDREKFPLILIIPDLRLRKTGEPPRTALGNFRQRWYALIKPVRHPKIFPTDGSTSPAVP